MSQVVKHFSNGVINSRIASLFRLYIFKSLSNSEEEELEKWIMESDENFELFQRATHPAVLQDGFEIIGDQIDASRRYQNIKKKLVFKKDTSVESIQFNWKWIVAASVLVIVGSIAAIYYSVSFLPKVPFTNTQALLNVIDSSACLDKTTSHSTTKKDKSVKSIASKYTFQQPALSKQIFSAPQGDVYALQLEDGTKVWLNASSSIKYSSVFLGDERKVTISGEVFFEVAKYSENGRNRPFIVELQDKNITLEVMSTTFIVNAYPNNPLAKTTLLEGYLKVTNAGQSILLEPGQQAEIKYDEVHVKAMDRTDLNLNMRRKICGMAQGPGNKIK